ncbi:MAG: hypothetical protein HUU50_02775 [Candidatus Brocadiae bacterium]|nr:hypothetical protein [Candidatus Brocadiia bacterium]
MNIKLCNVITNIFGTSGLNSIQAILKGERNLAKLADLKDCRAKASKQEIIKSLEGDYREEHLFSLKQALDAYKFGQEQLTECDLEIEKYLQKMDKQDIERQVTFEFIPIDNIVKLKYNQ